MKHHSQVFIAIFVLILLINIFPLQEDRLQEGYIDTVIHNSNIFEDISDNPYDYKWLKSENGGNSNEFKFSDKFNYKFKNPIVNTDISTNTINKPDFKMYDYYWPISDIK